MRVGLGTRHGSQVLALGYALFVLQGAALAQVRPPDDGDALKFATRHPLSGEDVCVLAEQLRAMQGCEAEKKCPAGTRVMTTLFDEPRPRPGDPGHRHPLYNKDFPNLIVQFEADALAAQATPAAGAGGPSMPGLRVSTPRLIWRGHHTSHLFGVRQVWAVVFSEVRPPHDEWLYARRTVDQWTSSLPSVGLLGLAVPEKSPENLKSEAEGEILKFSYLGRCEKPGQKPDAWTPELWYAVKGFTITTETTDRISIYANPPKDKEEKPKEDGKPCCCKECKPEPDPSTETPAQRAEREEAERKKAEAAAKKKAEDEAAARARAEAEARERLPFLVTRGGFSNSRAGRVGVGVGLGLTRARGTRLTADSGSRIELGPYLFTKYYLMRPRIRVRQVGSGRGPFRWSLAIGAGTRVSAPFKEVLAGISIGHLTDRIGVFLGGNFIAPGTEVFNRPEPTSETKNPDEGKAGEVAKRFHGWKGKWAVGLEYTF